MKSTIVRIQQIGCLFLILALANARAEDFTKSSKITQVAGDVSEQAGGTGVHPAKLQDTVAPGDLLKTGADSRAELTAGDTTVIRVGANSIFSFSDQSRQMELQQGSVLFHTPHGEGGGVIKTAAITAAVTGSTVAMTTTSNGGAKVVPLESQCTVTGKDGRQIARLMPGQLLALLPGSKPIVVNIDLGAFVKSSGLIKGFDTPLGKNVQARIDENVQKQEGDIQQKTNIFIVDASTVTESPLPNPNQQLEVAGSPTANSSTSQSQLPNFGLSSAALAAIQMNLSFTPNQITGLQNNLFPVPNGQAPIAQYIKSLSSAPQSGYFTNAMLSNVTLATLGISAAAPSNFTFPSNSQFLIGNNMTFLGTPDVSGTSGYPGDPNAANLGGNPGGGFFGIVALGNMLFKPSAPGSSMDISFIGSPSYLSFGAAGTLTMDGTILAGSNGSVTLNLNANDARNLSLASVGMLTLDQICVHAVTGNIFVGSQSSVNLYDGTMLLAGGNIGVNSVGNLNISNFTSSLSSSSPILTGSNIALNSGGSINITGTGAGSGTLINASNAITINSLADINLLGQTTFSAQTISLTAGNTLNINTSNSSVFSSIATINLTGFTIDLQNVSFASSSTVNLKAAMSNGLLNFTSAGGGSGGNVAGLINVGANVMSAGSPVNYSIYYTPGTHPTNWNVY